MVEREPAAACIAITARRATRASAAPATSPCAGPALLVAQAGLGDRRDRARELARRRLRRAAHVRGRELAEARERDEPLDDVGLGGEQLAAAQPEAVDEPVDEDVGPRRVERGGGRAVELEEPEDPLARLGRELRRLGRGDERADHVELAPPRDLHATREVDRAQLDRRAGERAHDGAGVGGVDEQPQPREHVLDLGALEERRRAGEAVRHGALLERQGDRLALVAHRAHEDRDLLGRHAGADEPLDLGGDAPAPGRARSPRARSAPSPPAGAARRLSTRSAIGRDDGARRPRRSAPGSAATARGGPSAGPGTSAARSRRFFAAAARRRRIAWSSSPRGGQRRPVAGEQEDEPDRGVLEVLRRRRRAGGGGAPRPARGRAACRAAARGRAGRGRRSRARPAGRAGGRASRTRRRTRARARRGRRPPAASAAQRTYSSAVTIASFRRSIRAMTPARSAAGLPRKSCRRSVSSSTCSSSIARRSAGVTGETNGSRPGLERLVVQQAGAEARDGVDGELLEAAVEQRLDLAAHGVGRRLRAGDDEHLLGRARPSVAASHACRCTSVRVLPVPAAPRTSSGPPRWVATACWAGVSAPGGSGTSLGYEAHGHRFEGARGAPVARLARRLPPRGRGPAARCSATIRRAPSASSRPASAARAATSRSSSTPPPRTPSSPSSTRLHARRRALHRRLRGARARRLRRPRRARRHRPDRRLAERQARPRRTTRCRSRSPTARRWPTSRSATSTTSGPGEEWRAVRGGGAFLNDALLDAPAARAPPPRRQARARRDRVGEPALARRVVRRARQRHRPRPRAWARSRSRSARSPRPASTAWPRCGTAARSTPPPASSSSARAAASSPSPRATTRSPPRSTSSRARPSSRRAPSRRSPSSPPCPHSDLEGTTYS